MSHTNHTQYYNLPQYAGSDIINPLVDTNGAYEAIDTAIHNIAAEAAQDTADVAILQSKVGSGVFDTTAQNATDAVNELVGELNTADTGVKARLTTAESDIDTLQSQMVTAQGNIVDLQNNKANASDVNALKTTLDHKLVIIDNNITVVDIVGDGVKNLNTILNDIVDSFVALASSLAADEVYEMNTLQISGYGYMRSETETILSHSSTAIQGTQFGGVFTMDATHTRLICATLVANLSSANYCDIDNSGTVTWVKGEEWIIPTTTHIRLHAKKYKIIT